MPMAAIRILVAEDNDLVALTLEEQQLLWSALINSTTLAYEI
jgi:hypothetical protein